MSFRFRVVPQKKRRKARSYVVKKPFARRSLESWLTDPSLEQRVSRRLPAYVYASLESISSPTTYGKDTVLFVEGQKPMGAFVVRKGCVKLSACSADGKSLIVGRAEAGDVLGLPTAISGRPNELTAEAVQPVQCNFISRDAFLRYLRKHRAAAFNIAEVLSDMYSSTFHQLRNLGLCMTAPQRLARLLLDLSSGDYATNGNGTTLLTHKEMGELIGISRETVSRLFARFKREQLVRVNDSRIVLNRDGLERLLVA